MPDRDPSCESRRLVLAARYAPPLLLLLVGLSQVVLASHGGLLTPGKGGGFGFFSTVDKLANRKLAITLIDASGTERPWAPRRHIRSYWRVERRALSFPTSAHLDALARRAAARVDTRSLRALRVEVRKKSFDAASRQVRHAEVARYVLELDDAAP